MAPDVAPRILVVDDEPDVRAGLAAVLEREGYAVELAAGGPQALARVAEGRLDLMVTDLRMPDLSGIELLRAVRQAGADMPVLVMTAHWTVEDAVTAMKLGAFDLLTKPFPPGDVLRLVARALETRTAPATTGERPGRPWRPDGSGEPRRIERAVLLALGGELAADDLVGHDVSIPRLGGSLAGLTVHEVERRLIFDTLERTRNNRTQAARLLGISIRTLRNKLATYRRQGLVEAAPARRGHEHAARRPRITRQGRKLPAVADAIRARAENAIARLNGQNS